MPVSKKNNRLRWFGFHSKEKERSKLLCNFCNSFKVVAIATILRALFTPPKIQKPLPQSSPASEFVGKPYANAVMYIKI